jgi:recombinational DNA repair protein (RecF pathway)
MKKINLTSIILKKYPLKNTHLFLVLLTRELGLIKTVSFGSLNFSKRFKGSLDYFKILNLEATEQEKNKNKNYIIENIKEIKYEFKTIPKSIEKMSAASYIQDLTSELLNQEEKTSTKTKENFFNIVSKSIYKIDNLKNKNEILTETYNLCLNLYKQTGFIDKFDKNSNKKLNILKTYNDKIIEKNLKSFSVMNSCFI